MLKKIVCIVLCIVLICAMTTTSLASSSIANSDVSTRMTHIMNYNCNLSINSSGYSTSSADVQCYTGIDKVRITIYLQQYSNGSWTTIKSWSQDYTGTSGQMIRTQYVTSGYWYRVQAKMYAFQGSTIVESVSGTSSSVWY